MDGGECRFVTGGGLGGRHRLGAECHLVSPIWQSAKIVGRAFLPAAGFQPALAASKGGCGQDWPPHNLGNLPQQLLRDVDRCEGSDCEGSADVNRKRGGRRIGQGKVKLRNSGHLEGGGADEVDVDGRVLKEDAGHGL